MAPSQSGIAEPAPLGILGIGEAEERVYRCLLTHAGATVPQIAQALALASGKVQRLVEAIETKGLATHTPERPRRYLPASPDIALKALALRRQESLQRAEREIQNLQEQAVTAQAQGMREQIVELVTSREAERQALEQMQRAAQHELVSLMKAPMRVSRLDVPPELDANTSTQRETQARGVRYRSIVDTEYLDLPGAVARMQSDAHAGEEIRTFSGLPLKLVLVDRSVAIIPLKLHQPDSPSLIVRSSALLDALYTLFEILWERAAPVLFTSAGTLTTGIPGSRLSKETEELIALMAAGLNDKKIASELGISMRTLRRRIVELMKALNARTRFQIAWLAAAQFSGSRRD